jgi:hypothetical protein
MKNIHLLPTDKPSRLTIRLKTKHLIKHSKNPNLRHELMCSYKEFANQKYEDVSLYQNQNIYITNDDKIKEGDYGLDVVHKCIVKITKELIDNYLYKKIILTTDQDLIKNGVQSIDNEFLQWFVKNPSCEFVDVVKEGYKKNGMIDEATSYRYKIIIPQEEPKKGINIEEFEKKANLIIENVGKEETLEEVIKTYCKNKYGEGYYPDVEKAIEFGAKWQAARMYSEEDIIEFSEWADTSKESSDFWRKNRRSPTMDNSHHIYIREKRLELFQIWKEKFKKK